MKKAAVPRKRSQQRLLLSVGNSNHVRASLIVLLEPGGWTTPCGRARFPVKGTEFSTVNHLRKNSSGVNLPATPPPKAPSDASKKNS